MKWEYRTIVLSAQAQEPETKAYLQKLWPGWEPPKFAPQALIPKLNDYGADGWELMDIQCVHLDGDANVLVHGGPTPPENAVTGMVKARVGLPPSQAGSEPTRYSHTYLCTLKRRVKA